MIDIKKKYRTASSEPVRILCVDGPGDQPVIGIHDGTVEQWTLNGRFLGRPSKMDLIEVTPFADIAVDTPVWVRMDRGEWVPRHFSGVTEEGNPMCFTNGRTSHSAEGLLPSEWDEFSLTKPEGV